MDNNQHKYEPKIRVQIKKCRQILIFIPRKILLIFYDSQIYMEAKICRFTCKPPSLPLSSPANKISDPSAALKVKQNPLLNVLSNFPRTRI